VAGGEEATAEVRRLLPGLGDAIAIRLEADAPSVGRSLKELDLRSQTGATVIAIDRGPDDVVYPQAGEVLRAGDTLVLTGTKDAVRAAAAILVPASPVPASPVPASPVPPSPR
jgi:CPA2 family monovalent cation:H+ antiporter-2